VGVRSRWLGLAGLDVSGALGQATTLAASPAPTCPPIREALPAFLAHQVEVGEIRREHRVRLPQPARGVGLPAHWRCPVGPGVAGADRRHPPEDPGCEEEQGIRCPLTRFYQWQANVNGYRGA